MSNLLPQSCRGVNCQLRSAREAAPLPESSEGGSAVLRLFSRTCNAVNAVITASSTVRHRMEPLEVHARPTDAQPGWPRFYARSLSDLRVPMYARWIDIDGKSIDSERWSNHLACSKAMLWRQRGGTTATGWLARERLCVAAGAACTCTTILQMLQGTRWSLHCRFCPACQRPAYHNSVAAPDCMTKNRHLIRRHHTW